MSGGKPSGVISAFGRFSLMAAIWSLIAAELLATKSRRLRSDCGRDSLARNHPKFPPGLEGLAGLAGSEGLASGLVGLMSRLTLGLENDLQSLPDVLLR